MANRDPHSLKGFRTKLAYPYSRPSAPYSYYFPPPHLSKSPRVTLQGDDNAWPYPKHPPPHFFGGVLWGELMSSNHNVNLKRRAHELAYLRQGQGKTRLSGWEFGLRVD